jgi:hypothetical protein
MFLKQKKGNLVAQFVVLVIIATILIFTVSSFGSKIWQAFFPSADKSTLKSFDAVFNVFNAKAISQQDYDSTTMSIYLKEGYRIIFFDENGKLECKIKHWGMPAMGTFYAPKTCKPDKQCMCLYKEAPAMDKPPTDTADREKKLIKCYTFENKINVDEKYSDLNKVACNNKKTEPYGTYMFIKRSVYPPELPEKKDYVYVLENTEENRALDAKWRIPVCKTLYPSNPCYGKKDGDTVEATDQSSLDKIYNYCKNKEGVAYKSLSVKCEYPQGGTDCDTNCKYGDITDKCNVIYSTCEDYNQLIGTMGNTISSTGYRFIVNYISADEEYKYYGMCNNNVAYCNVNEGANCFVTTWNVYACKNSPSGTAYDSYGTTSCLSPQEDPDLKSANINCNVEFLKDLKDKVTRSGGFESFITSYDENNAKCKEYMEKNFYEKQSIMTCKKDKTDDCQKFIEGKERFIGTSYKCQLKFIEFENEYWLTHYDFIYPDCEKSIKELFTTVSLCKSG